MVYSEFLSIKAFHQYNSPSFLYLNVWPSPLFITSTKYIMVALKIMMPVIFCAIQRSLMIYFMTALLNTLNLCLVLRMMARILNCFQNLFRVPIIGMRVFRGAYFLMITEVYFAFIHSFILFPLIPIMFMH